MKIVEYSISSQLFVKPEITRLSPWTIQNDSDNFYIIIPTVTSQLPDNVMFIQETLIVDPHTKNQYVPKLIKLNMNLTQSYSVKIPNGIKIRLLIIDDVKDLSSIEESKIIKGSKEYSNHIINKPLVVEKQSNNVDPLLSSIDNKLNEDNSLNLKAEDNSATPIISEITLGTGNPVSSEHTQCTGRRGRPPKRKNE